MSFTLTFQDAWSMCSDQIQSATLNSKLEFALNKALGAMWQAYDWRGTVAELPPFWLVPLKQDYGSPFYTVPSDFLGLRETYLCSISSAPPLKRELHVQKFLQESNLLGLPTDITYLDAISGFRVWPLPYSGCSSPLYCVDGTYKKQPPRILRANLGDNLLWADMYFDTFVDACAWASLSLMGPARKKDALEQYQVFLRSLAIATGTDALENGPPAVHPSESLLVPAWGGANTAGFFY